MQHRRCCDFIRFLNVVEVAVPFNEMIRAILANVASHKHQKVRAWLARYVRSTSHFAATSASWLTAVQGFVSA